MPRSEQHPYCYPGTDVYRNKEDIRDAAELEAFERTHSANRLETLPRDFLITPEGYRKIHQHLLQDGYDWAGRDRFVNTGRTAPFCKVDFIAPELEKRFAAINAENDLGGLDAGTFAERAAEHISEINAIPPFSMATAGRFARSCRSLPTRPATTSTSRASILESGSRLRSGAFTAWTTAPCAE